MPQVTGGGSSISKKAARKIGRKSAVSGEKTGRVNADRSKVLVSTGTQRKAFAKGYRSGSAERRRAGGILPAKMQAKAEKYVEKRASQFKKSVAKTARKTGRTKREVISRRTGR